MFIDSNVPHTILRPENTDEPPTYGTWHVVGDKKKLTINIENIKLIQDPSETLDLNLSISSLGTDHLKNYKQQCVNSELCNLHEFHKYSSTIQLQFKNEVHEFDENFIYEIACIIPAETNKLEDKYFLYCLEKRCSNEIKINNKISMLTRTNIEALTKMSFCIRRHSPENRWEHESHTSITISVLRTAGCDVVLQVKDGRLSTHKVMLAQHSPFFAKIFIHDLDHEIEDHTFNMPDFESRVVSKLLNYVYTGDLDNVEDILEQLFKLAHRYKFYEFSHVCEEYYIFNVKPTIDNITETLKMIANYNLKKLEKFARRYIGNHEKELSQSRSYEQYLMGTLTEENVVSMLETAYKYRMTGLEYNALNFIKLHEQNMMNNEDYMNLFRSNNRLMQKVLAFLSV